MDKRSTMRTLAAYLAGPEPFFPSPDAHARRKIDICARHGILGRAPLDNDIDLYAADASQRIYRANRKMMLSCDIIVANLTPFRGPSADDGTAFELGFFDALCRPAFAFSNAAELLARRTTAFLDKVPDPVSFAVEDFGLPCNLMLPHAVLDRGCLPVFTPADGEDKPFDDLGTFERLVATIAECHAAGLVRVRA